MILKAIIFMVLITAAATAAGIAVRKLMKGKKKAARNAILVFVALVGFTGINFVGGYMIAPACFLMDSPDEEAHQEVEGLDFAKALSIDGRAGKMSGWIMESGDNNAPLVIYFGGNKECSALRMKYLSEDRYRDVFDGFDFACVDYPGYCDSEGVAGAKSFKQYGLDVYDYLTKERGSDCVYIMGYSIGTGVANYVASKRACDGLILLAPYGNGSDLYNTVCNIFHGPLNVLVGFKMDSDDYAKSIELKPLILAAGEDEVIPWECAKRLSGNYPNGADFVLIDGIGHSNIWTNEQALELIKEYIKE
ncbi:MAG: alpha/beta hydrolase [Butyrivibrio sp.]|nr:alpha/beta hydrolase [Butyrivibrio sp.]